MFKNRVLTELFRGIFKENATFVLVLGLCPTLGVTTSGLMDLVWDLQLQQYLLVQMY